MNLPNTLTTSRIALTPLTYFLLCVHLTHGTWWSFFLWWSIFTFNVVSDFLDGFLARFLNVCTVIGKELDPLADKVFAYTVMLVLVKFVLLNPVWIDLLLFRDLVVSVFRHKVSSVRTNFMSKCKTAFLFVAVGLTSAFLHDIAFYMYLVVIFLAYVTAVPYFAYICAELSADTFYMDYRNLVFPGGKKKE